MSNNRDDNKWSLEVTIMEITTDMWGKISTFKTVMQKYKIEAKVF
jgi:hypothetical protein